MNNKRHSLSVISTVTNKGQMRWKIFDGALNAKILIDFLRRQIKGKHAVGAAAWLLGWDEGSRVFVDVASDHEHVS